MTGFAAAVERRDWRVVSLYLLLGVSEAASKLPPEALSELLELLGAEESPKSARRRRHGG
jgi:hypothetical protein